MVLGVSLHLKSSPKKSCRSPQLFENFENFENFEKRKAIDPLSFENSPLVARPRRI